MATKLLKWGITGGCAVGGLISKLYEGPYESLVKSNAWDVLLPIMAFHSPFLKNNNRCDKYINAGLIFAGCSAAEVAQYFGLWHGTFDPKDFVAYGIGTVLALGIDKIAEKASTPKSIDGVVG